MTERAQIAVGLSVLLILSIVPAISAGYLAPPGNDLLLHGHLVAGAADTLRAQGWTAFQDPWFSGLGAGFPIFHHYPHLPHQVAAVLSVLLGLDPWTALAVIAVIAVIAMGPAVVLGARWLGLSVPAALLAGLVAITIRSADPFGHASLSYGFNGHGLFGQLVGMVLAALAVPAWWRASRPGAPLVHGALAAVLVSAVIRSSLPAAWVSGIVLGVLLLGEGRTQLGGRLGRAAAVAGGAVVLSAGFLVPFLADLGASGVYEIVDPTHVRSFGAVEILRRLVVGDYLDGIPGAQLPLPWTVPFLVAISYAIGRPADRTARGLAWAAVAAIVLLFGRATWGDWIDRVPLVGTFHDRRYVLGIQLVAPWLLAFAATRAWAALEPRWRVRLPSHVPALVVVLAAPMLLTGGLQLAAHHGFAGGWRSIQAALDPAVTAIRHQDLRVELAAADGPVGGASLIDTLRMAGVATTGKPLHHYALIRQAHLWWRFWLADPGSPRDRPPTADDLFAFGAHALVVPTTWLPAASDLADWPRQDLGPLALLTPPGRADRHRGLGLVRSDLLVHAETPALQGLGVAWHQSGAPAAGQFPTVAIAGTGATPPAGYARTAQLVARDPRVLLGLPTAAPGALGTIRSATDWSAELDDVQEGAWLIFGAAWHPRLRATVDGQPATVQLLLPGRAGVKLAPGARDVALTWSVHPLRGAHAAVNGLLCLGLLAAGVRRRSYGPGS